MYIKYIHTEHRYLDYRNNYMTNNHVSLTCPAKCTTHYTYFNTFEKVYCYEIILSDFSSPLHKRAIVLLIATRTRSSFMIENVFTTILCTDDTWI